MTKVLEALSVKLLLSRASGLPKVSLLEPLLFPIFIIDIVNNLVILFCLLLFFDYVRSSSETTCTFFTFLEVCGGASSTQNETP